jgi:hypothetical protein
MTCKIYLSGNYLAYCTQPTVGLRRGSDAGQRTTALVDFGITDGELVAFQSGLQA